MKLMQSRITLRGSEIDFTVDALKKIIERYKSDKNADLAKPYEQLRTEIQQTRSCGNKTEATIRLTGGSIDCVKFAVKTALESEINWLKRADGENILRVIQNNTRPVK